jgi:hypothetical protein
MIDFRVRPPYGGYTKFFENQDVLEYFAKGFGVTVTESVKQASFRLFLKELDEAGIDLAVIPGRGLIGIDNRELFQLSEQYPDRFVIFPYVNPLHLKEALAETEELVVHGKGKGIAIEPGVGAPEEQYAFDDERVLPYYQYLEEHKIPLMITFSAFAVPEMDIAYVKQLDHVARAFPKMKIIVAHGGWPWVREMIAIAFARGNVYLIPDIYGTHGSAAKEFEEAAKHLIPNRIIYGSSYPIGPVGETSELMRAWDVSEETRRLLFEENAREVLGLYAQR